MRIALRAAPLAVVVAMAPLLACHRTSAGREPAPIEAGEIGDSAAFTIRIVGFNGARDLATFELAAPAHVVALAVVPGRSVELIQHAMSGDTAMTAAGVHELRIAFTRQMHVQPAGTPRLVDQVEYQRCVDRRVRAVTRQKPTKMVVRDSAGRETTVDGPREAESPIDAEREAERMCAGMLRNTVPNAPRPADRSFIVLIASDVRIPPAQLHARLDAMTVTASDVPTTMASVADALFFDRRALWTGYFKRW